MGELTTQTAGAVAKSVNTHSTIQANLQSFDNLPDLETSLASPVSLTGAYWTPEAQGESKNVFFLGFQTDKVISQQSGEPIDLDVVAFVQQSKSDKGEVTISKITNGSKRLVGIFEDLFSKGTIKEGSAVCITYLGKKKNKTNQNMSDAWDVRQLFQKLETEKTA